MSLTPSPQNYTLGRGIVYFDRALNTTGLHTGERDLGNASTFNVSVELEKLEHFSSRAGLRAKDKEVVLELTPTITFTLDEFNVENLKLALFADSVEVVQADQDIVVGTGYKNNRYRFLGFREIGVLTIPFITPSGAFTAGETVTGGTSGATAVVLEDDGPGTRLLVKTIGGTPPFVDAELITGGTSTSTATTSGLTAATVGFQVASGTIFDATEMFVEDSVSTRLVKDTDYTIDSGTGRIRFLPAGLTAEDDAIAIEGHALTTTYEQVRAFKDTVVEGFLHFVGDPATGTQAELKAWRVSLELDGDMAFIGDEFLTIDFTGEVLQDLTCHPDSPFMDIIMAPDASAGGGAQICEPEIN